MSQKKVDYYKASKATRNKAARKEKIIDRLEILAWILIAVAMIGWIGYSAYVKLTATDTTTVLETTFDNSALNSYISGLSSTETDEEETTAEETTAEETDAEDTEEASEETEEASEASGSEEDADAAEDTETAEKEETDSTEEDTASEDTAEEETAE